MRLVLCAALLALATATSAKVCHVPHTDGADDSIALNKLMADPSCSSDATVVFDEDTTYNISTPVKFGTLKNVEIQLLGNLEMPRSIPHVQQIVNASGGRLYWFTVAGTNITLTGNQHNPDKGWINWHGWNWWKLAPVTQPLGGIPNRPHNFQMNANSSTVRYLKVRQQVAWGFSLSGNDNHLYENRFDAAYNLAEPQYFPFNTDGYDVSGNNILIENGYVFNGDDCVAVNKGNNITVRNMTCIGGHGASISAANGVSNVLFDRIHSVDSLYATRFKSSLNAVGNVTNVTWSNIDVVNATFPIFATGVYFDQNTNRGMVPGMYPANATATHITNFRWENVSGTINDVHPGDGSCTTDPCWYYVANATKNAAVTLQLLNHTATHVQLRNINLKPWDKQGTPNVLCNPDSFIDGVGSLGFDCKNGPYTPSGAA